MLFVVEHLEPRLSEWLCIEYSHAARIAGDELLITNVKRKDERRRLSATARVESKRASELFRQGKLIVLDPCAKKKLTPADFRGKEAVVIGGILGGDPPLGRTRELLTGSMPRASKRNIGEHQLAIDGAVYVAKEVSEGTLLEDVPMQCGLEVHVEKGHSVILPYAYPVVEGRPLISKKLISYVKRPWLLSGR